MAESEGIREQICQNARKMCGDGMRIAGICGIAVTPDLYYWDCPRHQEIIGKYPQPIREVLRKNEDTMNPFDTCLRYIRW